jgi:hypothetical protein
MKKIFLLSLALLSLTAALPRAASAARFGLGLILGDPTGISAKLWMTQRTALDGCFGWSFGDNGFTRIHVDYLWHSPIRVDEGRLWCHYGVGGAMWLGNRHHTDDDLGLGARGVLGLEYQFRRSPFSLFGEVAPTMNIVPGGWFDMEGGAGFRFYF